MADLLAIISKAQFEAAHRNAKVGETLNFTKYVSTHPALEPVRGGGSLFLVTVRPPDERLWLVGELVNPKHDGAAWVAKASTVPVRDVTALLSSLKFTTGKGVSAKKGALGMSLQTPRQLTEADVALLRGGARPARPAKEQPPVEASAAPASSSRSLPEVLAEWRQTRAPELEALIVTLGQHHARAFPPLDPAAPNYDAAWNARANAATPEDLDHLLPGLWSDPRGSIPMRLRKLLDLGPDPRLGEALLRMIDDPPLTASSNFSAWTMLFKALPSMVDTRAAKRLTARAKKKGGASQFWPKLTGWIQTALANLPSPATLSKTQAASVAKRQKEATALLKGAPPASAPTKTKAVPTTAHGAPGVLLETALAAAKNGRPLEALEPLRAYWALTRLPLAAELMTSFARLGRSGQPEFATGKPPELHARWLEAARTFDAALVTPLLEGLLAGKLTDAEERLEVMLSWPADPRVAEAMCDRCIDGRDPYIGARPQLWKRVYELLVVSADPRFEKRLTKQAERLASQEPVFDRDRARRPHATRTIAPYLEAIGAAQNAMPSEQKQLQALSALAKEGAEKKKAEANPDLELAMLLAINAAEPSDVTPYLVYADFLAERGDPRAELINLSIALERGEKVKGQYEAWFKKHERALLGNLKLRIHKPAQAVHRGLLPALSLDPWGKISDSDLGPMAEDLRWVTVRTVSLPHEAKKHTDFLLTHAPLYGVEHVHRATNHFLELMCARTFPWAVKVISFSDSREPLSPKVKPEAFPKLEVLDLNFWKPLPQTFFTHALFGKAKRLTSGEARHVSEVPVDTVAEVLSQWPNLASYEGWSRGVRAKLTAVGDGMFDAELDVGVIDPKRDEVLASTLAAFKRLTPKQVRSVKLGQVATVPGYSNANPESTKLAEAATKHLRR